MQKHVLKYPKKSQKITKNRKKSKKSKNPKISQKSPKNGGFCPTHPYRLGMQKKVEETGPLGLNGKSILVVKAYLRGTLRYQKKFYTRHMSHMGACFWK